MSWRVVHGDCIEVMRAMEPNSVDAVVTDPPYELNFMAKGWDRSGVAYNVETWREALRVLKPGGHLVAFGGTRTYHRMTCAIEDAGFEIRDCLQWLYGSGFPKSLDVSKGIDAVVGAEREILGRAKGAGSSNTFSLGEFKSEYNATLPTTPAALCWSGWGTALKPANEPIVLARKPLIGTVVQNVLAHGTGAINVDGCRIGTNPGYRYAADRNGTTFHGQQGARIRQTAEKKGAEFIESTLGRWPANVVLSHAPECKPVGTRQVKSGTAVQRNRDGGVHNQIYGDYAKPPGDDQTYADENGLETIEDWDCVEDCPVRILDEQSGDLHARGNVSPTKRSQSDGVTGWGVRQSGPVDPGDMGGASRFFYCAKASREEREQGCERLPLRTAGEATGGRQEGSDGLQSPRAGAGRSRTGKGFTVGEIVSYPPASWVNAVLDRALPADTVNSLRKATVGSTIRASDGTAWSTCLCGSPSTDLSHPAIRSIIETATGWTTASTTSNSPRQRHTNGCMAVAFAVRASGGSPVGFAVSSSRSDPSTGISVPRDGPSTDDVDDVTSVESWLTNEPAEEVGRRVGVRNVHPT